MTKRLLFLFVPIVLFLVALFVPPETYHMPGLTVMEQRIIAIFILTAGFWILEPIPIHAASVLAITLMLAMTSNKGLFVFRGDEAEVGKALPFGAILATFANPTIMLFTGGFFLAAAATKYRLDLNLARIILKPFGKRPGMIMLGLMCITALFSMFMSNTATCAMMLALLNPVLATLPSEDRIRAGLALSVPFAANIGGIGTPIGTPPNAIGLQFIQQFTDMSFAKWMVFGVPYIAILLLLSWMVLMWLFPPKTQEVELVIEGQWIRSPKAMVAYAGFAVTVVLWMLGDLHGMNSEVVAMLPIALFAATGVITIADMKKLSWDVLWLMAGGIAIGYGMDKTGLLQRMVSSIPFDTFSPYLVIVFAGFLALLLSTFMSNTAAANLLMPLMAALAVGIKGLDSLGGPVGILLAVTFSCSLAMSLPISTPPNALAMATGTVQTKDMAKAGILVGIIGFIMIFAMLWLGSLVNMWEVTKSVL